MQSQRKNTHYSRHAQTLSPFFLDMKEKPSIYVPSTSHLRSIYEPSTSHLHSNGVPPVSLLRHLRANGVPSASFLAIRVGQGRGPKASPRPPLGALKTKKCMSCPIFFADSLFCLDIMLYLCTRNSEELPKRRLKC